MGCLMFNTVTSLDSKLSQNMSGGDNNNIWFRSARFGNQKRLKTTKEH